MQKTMPMRHALTLIALYMPVLLFSQVHYVKLKSFPPKWERLEIGFVIYEVIDRRVDTTNIGYALTGMGNKRKAAKFKKRLPVELKRVADELVVYKDGDKDSVLLLVREFHVSELDNIGRLNALVDCYQKQGGVLYKMKSLDLYKEYKGIDVTRYHSEAVIRTMKDLLGEIAPLLESYEGREEDRISWVQLLQQPRSSFVIDTSTQLKKGIYRSYVEFIANDPGIADVDIRITEEEVPVLKLKQVEITGPEGKEVRLKENPGFWGFSDGAHVYLNLAPLLNYEFYSRLEKIAEYSPFKAPPSKTNGQGAVIGGILGGAIGGAIAGAANELGSNAYVYKPREQKALNLSLRLLWDIIREDEELVQELREEKRRDHPDTKLEYLKRFYERRGGE